MTKTMPRPSAFNRLRMMSKSVATSLSSRLGGRFVEEFKGCARSIERASDGDELLNGDREFADRSVTSMFDARRAKVFSARSTDFFPLHASRPLCFGGRADVFGDGKIWDQVDFLVDGADAGAVGRHSASAGIDAGSPEVLPASRLINAGEDLD